MKEFEDAYKILVEKSEGNMPLGRPRFRWVGKIKIISKE
jgi:hypothetical protein